MNAATLRRVCQLKAMFGRVRMAAPMVGIAVEIVFCCMVICCVPRASEQRECVSAFEEEIGRTKD